MAVVADAVNIILGTNTLLVIRQGISQGLPSKLLADLPTIRTLIASGNFLSGVGPKLKRLAQGGLLLVNFGNPPLYRARVKAVLAMLVGRPGNYIIGGKVIRFLFHLVGNLPFTQRF